MDNCWFTLYWDTLNPSESHPPSYEATNAVAKKEQKKFFIGFSGIRTLENDFGDKGVMLYQLSYEAGIHRIIGNDQHLLLAHEPIYLYLNESCIV